MVIGFVNSGMMKLKQAIGIIMGANIRPVLQDGFYVSPIFKVPTGNPESFVYSDNFCAWQSSGIILRMFIKEQCISLGNIMLGFSILMTGMQTMSGAVAPLKKSGIRRYAYNVLESIGWYF